MEHHGGAAAGYGDGSEDAHRAASEGRDDYLSQLKRLQIRKEFLSVSPSIRSLRPERSRARLSLDSGSLHSGTSLTSGGSSRKERRWSWSRKRTRFLAVVAGHCTAKATSKGGRTAKCRTPVSNGSPEAARNERRQAMHENIGEVVSLTVDSSVIRSAVVPDTMPRPPSQKKFAKFSVSFRQDESITHYIPSGKSYPLEIRRAIWYGYDEVKRNVPRNKLEFEADGCDWRQATEEKDMPLDPETGERVHPVHVRDYHRHDRNRTWPANSIHKILPKRQNRSRGSDGNVSSMPPTGCGEEVSSFEGKSRKPKQPNNAPMTSLAPILFHRWPRDSLTTTDGSDCSSRKYPSILKSSRYSSVTEGS